MENSKEGWIVAAAEEERSLFPVFDIPEVEEDEEEYDTDFKPSFAWDIAKGDFVIDAKHQVVRSDGYEAYKIWCFKAVQTGRLSCLAYDDDDGTELEDALKEGDEKAVELAVSRTIQEALLVNPRTEAVEDFVFGWEPGELRVSFTVIPSQWEEFSIKLTLDR